MLGADALTHALPTSEDLLVESARAEYVAMPGPPSATPNVLELARRLYEAGVPLLVGTDGTGGGPARSLAE